MIFSDELIDYLSALSKIELSDSEKSIMKEELNKLTDYMRLIDKVDLSSIDDKSSSELVNVLREDCVKPSSDRELILSSALSKSEEAFIVPKTVE